MEAPHAATQWVFPFSAPPATPSPSAAINATTMHTAGTYFFNRFMIVLRLLWFECHSAVPLPSLRTAVTSTPSPPPSSLRPSSLYWPRPAVLVRAESPGCNPMAPALAFCTLDFQFGPILLPWRRPPSRPSRRSARPRFPVSQRDYRELASVQKTFPRLSQSSRRTLAPPGSPKGSGPAEAFEDVLAAGAGVELRDHAVEDRVGAGRVRAAVDLLGVEVHLPAAPGAEQRAGGRGLRVFVLVHDHHSIGTFSRPWRRTLAIQINS